MTRLPTTLGLLCLLACLAGCSGQPTEGYLPAEETETAAAAPTRWVATTGSDAGPGTEAKPWRTLAHAAAVVVPGDVVLVRNGRYQGFFLERSGTAAAPITFRGESRSGVRITRSNGRTPDGINVENCNWVVIDSFVASAMPRAGIRAAVADHVTIRNCRCQNNATWGIFTGFCDYLLIENNTCSGSVEQHGIYVSNSGDYPVIRRNTCYGNYGCGIHSNGDASMGGDGTISHAVYDSNLIYGNGTGGGSGINCDGVTDSRITNNLLYDNHASGISLYCIDGASGSLRNRVINNTVVQAGDGRWALNVRDGSTQVVVRNNILLHTLSYRGSLVVDAASRAGFASDYNLCSGPFSADGDSTALGFAAWRALGYDAHSALATAAQIFVAPGSHNYRPLAPGPAIDTGLARLAPALDLLRRPRPAGAGVDIGCYEG